MQHYKGSGALIYVTERAIATGEMLFARDLGARLVPLHQLSNDDLDANLVFDVDLRNIETVRHLKTLLTSRGKGCRLFVVDAGNRVTSVHAQVLGANCIVARPAAPQRILEAIRNHYGVTPGGTAEAIIRASIDGGMDVLDGGFRALFAQTAFDSSGAQDASGRIADAIGDMGAAQWLETVRGYHIGTFQHCMLVTGIASAFATGLGMARRDVVTLTLAGMLHDIGKASVPIAILDKPGTLTASELEILRRHPAAGHEYLGLYSSIGPEILRSVRGHHELLDGSGYPDRLKGSEIDDITRIVTVCDIYAALIEQRAYKPARTPRQAMTVLEAMASAGKVEASLVRELGRIMLA